MDMTDPEGVRVDFSSPVFFFPVRHHSPACSIHLENALAAHQPDAILIEGPSDTNELVPHLASKENVAPICIYYSYVEGEHRSACYFPLLDFSPELRAIRFGARHGIPTRFIDLPYSRLAFREHDAESAREKAGKPSYYDDYYLFHSEFVQKLCEKQNCRHYGELWEKLFEMHGLTMDTPTFIRSLLALCRYSREGYPEESLREEGCLEREEWMAKEIRSARETFARLFVVTGGFHSAALAKEINTRQATEEKDSTEAKPKGESKAWLIPYSFEESDQLLGYASGMPFPAFYQAIFENLRGQDAPVSDANACNAHAFNDAVLHFLARIGGALRRDKEGTSIADEIAASMQSRGLADLRGKPQQGVYELLDGVRSAYVKGDMDFSAARIMDTAVKLLRGDSIGKVGAETSEVPLLLDFRETARKLRLKVAVTSRQEATLNILSTPAHRAASVFFRRMKFLGTTFCEMKVGPNFSSRDTSRVREIWSYAMGAKVESQVIDVSYLGGTVKEAASTALLRARRGSQGAEACSMLLIDAAVMDLVEHIEPFLSATEHAIAEDGSFSSLVEAGQNLLFLESAKWLLALPDSVEGEVIDRLLASIYAKTAALLPVVDTANEEEDMALAEALKDLYRMARRDGFDGELLMEALSRFCERQSPVPPPSLQGAAVGLLYVGGRIAVADVVASASSYLYGSGAMIKRSGRFLRGLFATAWDVIFDESGDGAGFLDGIGNVLTTLSEEDFLEVLPDLRLAFSSFSPAQIGRIAEIVAKRLGLEDKVLLQSAVPEAVLALGLELDRYASERRQ